MTWDTVVIGSGPGGLAAAVALARAGQKVLVLEQHYLPGGWTHSFTLEGYRFSPGVHYIGDLGAGGGVRRIYEGLGVGADLAFAELAPDGFDHFQIAGERFDQPKGLARWRERLLVRFPHEREGILRYFATIERIVGDVRRCEEMLSFPEVLALPLRARSLVRWGLATHGALLDVCIKDPMLRAVLSAQSGNHGLAPSRVSLPLHACMAAHYFDGGYYPKGGAKRIPQAFIKELRRCGGAIRTKTRVARILVEGKRAVGVETSSGERILASNIVANADPALVYGRLLPEKLCRRQIRKVASMEYSVSLASMFCAVDMDLGAMGYDSGNYWYYRTTGVGDLYERMERRLPGDEVEGLFLTITTLKDASHRRGRHHTIEMFTFVPYAAFAPYRGAPSAERPAGYEALKRDLGDKMMAAAENIVPNIRKHVVFQAVGTPLTNDFYCETHRGAAYGTAKTPWQVGPFAFDARTSIDGLVLCGASTMSHGVAGATISGLVAAKHLLGRKRIEDLLGPADGSLRIESSESAQEEIAEGEEESSEAALG